MGRAYPRRSLFPAGRLDKTSTGFVLVTDDGAFAMISSRPGGMCQKPTRCCWTRPSRRRWRLVLRRASGWRTGSGCSPRSFRRGRTAVQRACGAAPGRVSSDQAHVRRIRRGRERAAAHGHRPAWRWTPRWGRAASASFRPQRWRVSSAARKQEKIPGQMLETAFSARCSQVFKTFFT